MRTEFGITSQESLVSGYTPYQPDAGLKSATLGLSGEYYFNDRLSVLGSLETEYYFSEASDSPLIDLEGDELTYEAMLLLRWRF